MAIIRNPDEMQINQYGDSCTVTILADRYVLGAAVMVTRRWSLKPFAQSPESTSGDYEEMLYVISGSGSAQVGDTHYTLHPECMLWLEQGDAYNLEAGPEGLEVLQYCAPDG